MAFCDKNVTFYFDLPCYNGSMSDIVLKSGGYRHLTAYRKAEVIYQGTVVFCQRFFPRFGDRTVDQMVQAARSCKQNLAEGSAASGTSKETEIKLTGVARATLDELQEDYLDYLVRNGAAEWPLSDPRKRALREWTRAHNDWSDYGKIFTTRDAGTLANLMITLIHQVYCLLTGMLNTQEAEFKQLGGIRERMTRARHEARGEEWEKVAFSKLLGAGSREELAALERAMLQMVRQKAWVVRRQRGW